MRQCGDKKASRLILCEGTHDVAFFSRLLDVHGISNYRIAAPQDPGGVPGFGRALRAIATSSEYNLVERILIVADNDENPKAQFRKVRDEIQNSGHRYGIPDRSRLLTKSDDGLPSVEILMLPKNSEPGCLETLLLDPIYSQAQQVQPALDKYCGVTGIDSWSPSKSAKARLRIMVASLNRQNPDLSLAWIWKERRTAAFIPLSGPEFVKLASYLEQF